MTAQTIEEFKAYLTKEHWIFNLHLDENPLVGFSPYYDNPETKCTEIQYPKTAGKFAHLAVTIPMLTEMDCVQWSGGTLVFSGWGIWEQRANLAGYQMVERIRSTFGENRPFHVAPVNSFRADEHLLMTNFILAALIYGWDAYYIPNYRGCFVHISHDEWCCVVTEREEDFKSVVEPQLKNPESGYSVMDSSKFCRPVPRA